MLFRVTTEDSNINRTEMMLCETPCLDKAYQAYEDAKKLRLEGRTVKLSATLLLKSDGPDPCNS